MGFKEGFDMTLGIFCAILSLIILVALIPIGWGLLKKLGSYVIAFVPAHPIWTSLIIILIVATIQSFSLVYGGRYIDG